MFNQTHSLSQLQLWSFVSNNTEAIALLFSAIFRQNTKVLSKHRSLFNVQSNSINFNFGHFSSAKYQFSSLFIALLFGQNTKVTASFSSLLLLYLQSSKSISNCGHLSAKSISTFGHFSAKYQGYSLTFWPNISLSSLFNDQSKSINVKCGHLSANYQGYSLTFWPQIAHFHHFSMFNQTQSTSIVVICQHNTEAIALLFAQQSLLSITFQCSIKLN